ncbi:hypothetical protein M2197_006385 [Bradyrhizobium japonicum]|nr:hypothetical protein [Bradyrhizobium japonicum]MCS3992864.1 hypothetical protein [Bradyrhizobium japonicum]MCS4021204.1 hypothetical protein [Bradyrhizobium japonicum]MCS4208313.1 hypothetical protein [Bradyrhizobium japonicum]
MTRQNITVRMTPGTMPAISMSLTETCASTL